MSCKYNLLSQATQRNKGMGRLKIRVCSDVILCCWTKVSHTRRLESLAIPLWERQISQW